MMKDMEDKSASAQIDDIIAQHGGWKAALLTQLRVAITQADPAVVEEVKWKMPSRPEGQAVWSHNGMLCMAEIFKNDVKLTFLKGAQLKDTNKLFNARLKSSTGRAIEFHEGDTVNETALKELVREAMEFNEAKRRT